MAKSNTVNLDPNQKEKMNRKNKYRKQRKAFKKTFVVELTENGKIYQEEIKEKEAKKKDVLEGALIDLMFHTKFSVDDAKYSMPPVEEVVQINVGDVVHDIHVINFEDGEVLKCFNDYERFVFTKSCMPDDFKKEKHRNSQCKTLKGK